MAIPTCETNIAAIFLRFEEFLRKAGKMNLFDTLVYNYRIKEYLSTESIIEVAEILNELIVFLKDLSQGIKTIYKTQINLKTIGVSQIIINQTEEVGDKVRGLDLILESSNSGISTMNALPFKENIPLLIEAESPSVLVENDGEGNKHIKNHDSQESDKNSVVAKLYIDYSEKVNIFCCHLCSYSYKTIDKFNTHRRVHNSKQVDNQDQDEDNLNPDFIKDNSKLQCLRKFICGLCEEEHRSFVSILFHLKSCEGGPFYCELCPSINLPYDTKKALTIHKLSTHKDEKSFICNECGKCFKVKCSLQKHMLRAHEQFQGPFKCNSCEEIFEKRILLTNHKLKCHSLDREFLCQQCGRNYSTKATLMTHLRMHTEAKKYICQFCSKQFPRKDKLQIHLMVHTGDRPFVCEYCGKRLSRKSKLDSHIRLHSRKQFICNVSTCSKVFSSFSDMKSHLLKRHGDENYLSNQSTPVPELVVGGNGIIQSSTEMARRRINTISTPAPTPAPKLSLSESSKLMPLESSNFIQADFITTDNEPVVEFNQPTLMNPHVYTPDQYWLSQGVEYTENFNNRHVQMHTVENFVQPHILEPQYDENESTLNLNYQNYNTHINYQDSFNLESSQPFNF